MSQPNRVNLRVRELRMGAPVGDGVRRRVNAQLDAEAQTPRETRSEGSPRMGSRARESR